MHASAVLSGRPLAVNQPAKRRSSRVSAVCQLDQGAVDRRRALPMLLIPAVLPLLAGPAQALGKDPRQLMKEKEARKAKLKEAADAMRQKGKTTDAFEESKYALPEEARTVGSK